jgi:hypothetical protein
MNNMTPEMRLADVRKEQEGNSTIKEQMSDIFRSWDIIRTRMETERTCDASMLFAYQAAYEAMDRFNNTIYQRSQQLTDESQMLRSVIGDDNG